MSNVSLDSCGSCTFSSFVVKHHWRVKRNVARPFHLREKRKSLVTLSWEWLKDSRRRHNDNKDKGANARRENVLWAAFLAYYLFSKKFRTFLFDSFTVGSLSKGRWESNSTAPLSEDHNHVLWSQFNIYLFETESSRVHGLCPHKITCIRCKISQTNRLHGHGLPLPLFSLTNWHCLARYKCCCAVLSKQNIGTPTFPCFHKAQPPSRHDFCCHFRFQTHESTPRLTPLKAFGVDWNVEEQGRHAVAFQTHESMELIETWRHQLPYSLSRMPCCFTDAYS
jgi:hypothetical protein